ncbi:MAG: type I methionyl aminopeptidase [Candidatus Omnitrophica bacterium]|nr:type I methionyl aminopeptidase [Candidatus Omnitrophota bacterium]
MSELLTPEEFALMRKAGKVASRVLRRLKRFIKDGITTKSIEEFFEKELDKYPGMEPAFKGFMGYPASLCVSVNEEIIHGIPSKRQIKDGDLVSVDLGIKYQGLFVDTAYTYMVGRVSPQAKKLVRVTLKSLYAGIGSISLSGRLGDVSSAVQTEVERNGFSVVRRFVGHGIGKSLHLPPEVPNFGNRGDGPKLVVGSAIAIEPMVSAGSYKADILGDGWTARTSDGSMSAHFEHTVAITSKGPRVITR